MNGEGFDDSQLWKERGLPDYNALCDGQPVDLAVTQWKLHAAAPAALQLGSSAGQNPTAQHFWQRPGCAATLPETAAGIVGTALSVGLVLAAGPEAWEGIEGALNLLHVSPALLPGPMILGRGAYQARHCG